MDFEFPLTKEKFYTDPTYFWYRRNFLELLSQSKKPTFNCTEGGTLFDEKLQCVNLDDFLKTARVRKNPPMAKILMINPIVREEDAPESIPYGITLLAAIALEKGHLVQIYDENAWRKGLGIMEQVCAADDWDVIAIGGLTTTYGSIKRTLKICRRVCPKAFIIAGGGFLTSMPKEMLTWLPEIDLGIMGEAFVTWPEVLRTH